MEAILKNWFGDADDDFLRKYSPFDWDILYPKKCYLTRPSKSCLPMIILSLKFLWDRRWVQKFKLDSIIDHKWSPMNGIGGVSSFMNVTNGKESMIFTQFYMMVGSVFN